MLALVLVMTASDLGSLSTPYKAQGSFVFDGDTRTAGPSQFSTYACASDKPEAGPELVFELTLQEESDVDLIVETPSSGVDIDVHLLASLARTGTQANDCIGRDDKNLAAFHLAAGSYFIVADTYGASDAKAGTFRLHARVYPTQTITWSELARGVRWGRGSHREATGFSVINVMDVDTSLGARIEIVDNGACKKLGALALPANAVAATNAGFFTAACAPDGLLRVASTTLAAAKGTQHAIGLQPDGSAIFAKPAAGSSFTDAPNAVGSFGYFDLRSGAVTIDHDGTTFGNVRHPRTLIHASAGRLGLVTLDGRSDAGRGATFSVLGEVLQGLGAEQGLNLDGGGSTVMWVKDEPMAGIVNYPSDSASGVIHAGVRAVRSLAVVLADPIVRPPFFVTLPDHRPLSDGESLLYAARAVARGGEPIVYTLSAFANATLSGSSLRFSPDMFQHGTQQLSLNACAAPGVCTTQRVTVVVALADSDGDGLPDAWEQAMRTGVAVADADADPDRDGKTNAQEYAARSDPLHDDTQVVVSGPTGLSATSGESGVSGGSGEGKTPLAVEPAAPQRGCGGCGSTTADPALLMALTLLGLNRGRPKNRTQRHHDRHREHERPGTPA
jgi:hypothetical protein